MVSSLVLMQMSGPQQHIEITEQDQSGAKALSNVLGPIRAIAPKHLFLELCARVETSPDFLSGSHSLSFSTYDSCLGGMFARRAPSALLFY